MIIDKKYRRPLTGKYNSGVYKCRDCGTVLLCCEPNGTVYQHIFGFADAYIGNVAMVECPVCFEKWYFHSRANESMGGSYGLFLNFLSINKHFK